MGVRGRKSIAEVAAVDSASIPIPPPPKHLSKEAAALWIKTVADKPAIWFEKGFNAELLSIYCDNAAMAQEKGKLLARIRATKNLCGLTEGQVANIENRKIGCEKQVNKLAIRLRLTASSIKKREYEQTNHHKKAATAANSNGTIQTKGDEPWHIDTSLSPGERVIQFIETHCRIPEGRYVGQLVVLRPWQKKIIRGIYDSPTRRGIISFGRKNAKTTLAALLLLCHLLGPMFKRNSTLFSDAQSKEQAGVLFTLAAKCVRLSPTLTTYTVVRDTVKQLACPKLGTLYRALSAEVATSFGLSSPFVVHDELGQVRGPRSELYEAMETAMGAYDDPLSIVISTQAPHDGDLLSILIDDAKTGADPKTKLFMFSAPMDMDPFTEEAWKAANPAYDDFLSAEEVSQQAETARRMPSREASFRNLILNQRVDANNLFVSKAVWEENGAPPIKKTKQKVWGGLDLAEVNDLCALVLTSDDGDIFPTFWLPEEGLKEKSRTDKVEYDVWAEQEYLRTTPGRSVEYEYIAEYLRGVFDYYDVQAIAFDRYNMRFLQPWLKKAGFSDKELEKFVEFGQGFVSMSPAIRELESRLLMKKLKHGMHPVLTMCAQNAVVVKDPAGNRKFNKAKATGRIDGMVALAMSIGSMPMEVAPVKKNQLFFV